MALLSDSINETLAGISDLVRGLPPGAKQRAQAAAVAFERTFQTLRVNYPRDPAVALGSAFAIFTIAERLVNTEKESDEKGHMIELLG